MLRKKGNLTFYFKQQWKPCSCRCGVSFEAETRVPASKYSEHSTCLQAKEEKADSQTNFSRLLNHGHPSILNNSENPGDIFLWK